MLRAKRSINCQNLPSTGGRFATLSLLDTDVNKLTDSFNEALRIPATETLEKHRKKKQPWRTSDILDISDKRREQKRINTTEVGEQYHRQTSTREAG